MLNKKILVAVAMLLSVCGCKKENDADTAAKKELEVSAIRVAPQDIPLSFEYPARAQGSKEVQVRARVGGILLKRNYIEGSRVKAGDVLFEIDPAQYKVALEKAQAQLAQSKAQLLSAQQDWSRISQLVKQRVVSEKSKDDSQAALDTAKAAVQAAQAQVDEAQLNLDYTKVTAPVSGITSLETQSEGSLISASGNDSLLTNITQIDPIYIIFSASESEIYALTSMSEKGMIRTPYNGGEIKAKLKYSSGDLYKYEGDINFINPTIDETTGTIKLRAVFPNPDGRLKPGQFLRLIMEGLIRINALVVPQEAVMQGAKGPFVYVVNDKGLVETRNIQTGLSTNDEGWIVDDGLQAGDVVITSGLLKIRQGMPVKANIQGEEKATSAGEEL